MTHDPLTHFHLCSEHDQLVMSRLKQHRAVSLLQLSYTKFLRTWLRSV